MGTYSIYLPIANRMDEKYSSITIETTTSNDKEAHALLVRLAGIRFPETDNCLSYLSARQQWIDWWIRIIQKQVSEAVVPGIEAGFAHRATLAGAMAASPNNTWASPPVNHCARTPLVWDTPYDRTKKSSKKKTPTGNAHGWQRWGHKKAYMRTTWVSMKKDGRNGYRRINNTYERFFPTRSSPMHVSRK